MSSSPGTWNSIYLLMMPIYIQPASSFALLSAIWCLDLCHRYMEYAQNVILIPTSPTKQNLLDTRLNIPSFLLFSLGRTPSWALLLLTSKRTQNQVQALLPLSMSSNYLPLSTFLLVFMFRCSNCAFIFLSSTSTFPHPAVWSWICALASHSFSLPDVGFNQLGMKGVLMGFSELQNEGLILDFFLHMTVNESGHSWPWQYPSFLRWIAPMAPASECRPEGSLLIRVVSDVLSVVAEPSP